jgi:hypothetical protein
VYKLDPTNFAGGLIDISALVPYGVYFQGDQFWADDNYAEGITTLVGDYTDMFSFNVIRPHSTDGIIDGFESVRTLSAKSQIETSKNSDMMAFNENTYFNTGAVNISPNGELNTWDFLNQGAYTEGVQTGFDGVLDTRTYDVLTIDTLSRRVAIVQRNVTAAPRTSDIIYADVSPIPNGEWNLGFPNYPGLTFQLLNRFDDQVSHFETTNSQDIPYMFTSIEPFETTASKFFQKDYMKLGDTETVFTEYSQAYGLPESKITCIRADDRV